MNQKLYICPGESRPISRSVHLARLAAFYPKCRDCALRGETGQLPPRIIEWRRTAEGRVEPPSRASDDGIRGVYLNEIDRRRTEQIAARLAAALWERQPPVSGDSRPQPSVVVGYDERPCSPDLVTGVVRSLRRHGCRVIDIGLTTKPAFWFAADHLEATAGLFVTGSGCEPSWTGLDVVGQGGAPLSCDATDELRLDVLDEAGNVPSPVRPTR
ncbi:MAG: hypothetical protein KY476_19900, partial [Planctomycetes bacterium]|nr:hypothetical protein [Planctomycetota bacterium]